jgi:NitT/TauT family transport system ATP-binding protein
LMTKRAEPQAVNPEQEGIPGTGVGMVLNHVSTNVLAGLIEAVAGEPFRGRADLPVLDERVQMEADELFHIAEALQLLRLAVVAEGDLGLTDAGRQFADLDTDGRKKLFARLIVEHVPIIGLIRRVLDERPSHRAPVARFRNELEDYMSEDYADETLDTVVSWGRFAELFAYDEASETFSLENPQ